MITRVLYALALAVVVVLAGIGIVAAPIGVVGAVGLGGVVGVLVANIVPSSPVVSGPRVVLGGWRGGVLVGAGAGVGLLVIVGLIAVLGTASGVILLVLGLLVVPAGWLWRRRPPVRPVEQPRPLVLEAVPPPPTTASTAALCAAWQQSYFALLDLPAGPRRDELVHLRRGVLDELERRDPAGFGRWLETGARANSDPSRYLTPEL